jgi:hypothetical protein
LFTQDRGVILADAGPAVTKTPPTVIAAAKSAAIALRLMSSPFMRRLSAAEFLLPTHRELLALGRCFLALTAAVAVHLLALARRLCPAADDAAMNPTGRAAEKATTTVQIFFFMCTFRHTRLRLNAAHARYQCEERPPHDQEEIRCGGAEA